MTIWRKQRLAVWCGISVLGGSLWWHLAPLRAQDSLSDQSDKSPRVLTTEPIKDAITPSRKLTREEAALGFGAFLDDPSKLDESPESFQKVVDTISVKSKVELHYQIRGLYHAMSLQWKQPNRMVEMQIEGDKTSTVTLKIAPHSLPLVLVEEDGSWGVDLVETYAKWNYLEGAAKGEAIYELTKIRLPGLPRAKPMPVKACQSNLKEMTLGLAQYAQDNNGKLPLAKRWIDALEPYVKNKAAFQCPSVTDVRGYGYAYNSKLSQKWLQEVPSPSEIVAVYETTILKKNAYGMGENRAFRHLDGANYAFADGHVKWFLKTKNPSFNLGPNYRQPLDSDF